MLTYSGHQTRHANEPKRVVLSPILRSLPVIISFMCQLEWPWIAQVKHYFWVLRVFLDEISIWIRRLREVGTAHPSVGRHPSTHWYEYHNRQKKDDFAFFSALLDELRHRILSSTFEPEFTPSAPLVHRLWTQISPSL